jgi:hypothetical protein
MQILDTGCLMLDKIRIITFKNQYPVTGIQHLLHKGNTMRYQRFLPQKAQKYKKHKNNY